MILHGLAFGLILCASLGAQMLGTQISNANRQGNPNAGVPSGKPPGSISGKVVNSVTGQGIKRAVVNVTGNGFGYEATTDGSGAFRIDNVEPGDAYFAMANCQGFESTAGARGFTKTISVQPSQEAKDVVIQLSPHATISGKITDRDGDPIENAFVTALAYNYNGGDKILRTFGNANTDDRGVYRIADLTKGTYYLAVSVNQVNIPVDGPGQHVHLEMPREAFPETFYPNVADPSQATPVQIKPGDDLTGIDFRLAKVPAFSIRGSVAADATAGGRGGRGGVQVQRYFSGSKIQLPRFVGARIMPDGTFEVVNAVPGSYVISSGQPNNNNVPYGSITVDVRDRDIDGVVVPVAPGFDLNGSVAIDGTPPASLPRINFIIRNSEKNASAQVVVNADMTLTVKNVHQLPYLLQMQPLQNLYVKSIRLGSQDISDGTMTPIQGAPLLITLGTDPGELDVTVQSPNSSTAGVWVVVYSARYPNRMDLTRYLPAQSAGAAQITGLAPGDYKALAIETTDPSDARNPDLRAALEQRAASATVAAGQHQTLQVTAVSADDVEAARAKMK